MRPSLIIVFDNLKDELSVVYSLRYNTNQKYHDALAEANTSIDFVLDLLKKPFDEKYYRRRY